MVGAILSKTPNYGFSKVRYDMPGWHTVEHDNWTLADSLLQSIGAVPGNRGIWTNSTAYAIGDRSTDPDTSQIYRCNVAHTSAATGTFAADRVANPTYWTLVSSVPVYRGAWVTAVTYNTQDIVTINNAYYLCVVVHTSGVFATDLAANRWVLIFSLQAAIDAQAAAEAAQAAAETAETNAETAETNAETAQAAAEAARNAAQTAETNAETAETNAETAETNAAASAAAAAASALDAANVVSDGVSGAIRTDVVQSFDAGQKLQAQQNMGVSTRLVPPCAGIPLFTQTAPTGTLKCNGAAVLIATYPNLIGIYCGDANNPTAEWGYKCTNPANPNGTRSTSGTYIVLPDMRGEFLRGWDDGRGVDSGRNMWLSQAQAIQNHTHTVTDPGHVHNSGHTFWRANVANNILIGGAPANAGFEATSFASATTGISIPSSGGGAETRPRNIAALWAIQYD
jgi:hypothetical protein